MERELFDHGIPSFIPYDDNDQPIPYPVIVKPIDGKYCRGVKVCNDNNEYLHAFHENSGNVIVQKYIPFEHECRVLVVNAKEGVFPEPDCNPEVVYIASKRNVARKGTKRKATFVPDRIRAAMVEAIQSDYVKRRKGIIGYDIGYLDGKTYIIEANYSPRFDRATDKLNQDIADQVVKCLM